MTLFDYLINFIEGLILSGFVAYYFDLKKKHMYIIIVSIICFLEITISNYYNPFDQILVSIIVLTLFLTLWFVKHQIHFEDIIICLLSEINLFLGNIFAVTLTSLIFHVNSPQIYATPSLLLFATILSKITACFIAIFIYLLSKKKQNYLSSYTLKIILILSLAILFTFSILLEIILTGSYTTIMIITVMISLMIIFILFLIILKKIELENEEKIKYALKVQKNEFQQDNYTKMQAMSNQIIEIEHRMMYIFMQIQNQLELHHYEQAYQTMDQYVKKVKTFHSAIHTNNPYFDFMMNRKIDDYTSQNIDVKKTLFIFENEIYDDNSFYQLISHLLDLFKKHLNNKKEINLGIYQEHDFIMIEVIGQLRVDHLTLPDNIYELIDYFDANYSLQNIGQIWTFKIIIELKNR